jgi:hypothetical protein
MSAVRITITLDEDVARELKAHVPAGEVSAFVAEAVRQRLRVDPVRALLLDLDTIHGPLSDDERREGDEWHRRIMQQLSSTPEP